MAIRQLETDPVESWLAHAKTADGVFAVDRKQRIVHWGSTAQELLGYTSQEVLGRPCHEVMGGRDARNYRFCRQNCPVIVNARRGRVTPNYDILVRTKDSAEAWINVSVLILAGNGQRPPVFLHLLRDVTQRRRVEERAQKAIAALRKFLAEDSAVAPPETDLFPTPPVRLTHRELEVLRLLACGLRTEQIAESLGVSPITARNHITNLLAKLGVENRLQAVLYASNYHLI